MTRWRRLVTIAGPARIVALLAGLFLAAAAAMALLLLASGTATVEVVSRIVLVGVPGAVLLYGAYRLPDADFHADVQPRIVAWTLGGVGVMAAVVLSIDLVSPSGVDNPVFAAPLATALGSLGGFAIGVHDARAKTRQRELEESVEQLRTANKRLEQFAHAASHDLQEPLRMVSSYLQLLERRHGDALGEDAREYVQFAVDGADRMRGMIDAVLAYSRVETRGGAFQPVDLDAVLEDALEDLHLAIEASGAEVTADVLPRVEGDPNQLREVLQNLVENAIDFSGEAPPRVHVAAQLDGSQWQLSVEDEGIGIDPEYHQQIFEPFERLQAEGQARSGGIGLALCERIVERHGGDIWVESAPGEGTTVYFTVPDTDEREPTTPQSTVSGARGTEQASITGL